MRRLRCFLMPSESEVAEMGVEDQNDGMQSKASATTCISQFNDDTPFKNVIQSKDTSSIGNVQMPKERKPYTITKQREKWTEEEHQKFLEALKLYGRGWRQIEEHVGTKTAVQIRSHAQKFFSKLVRESNGTEEKPIQPIVIPPPRPKKKPLHPYPRKLADGFRGNSTSNEEERSPLPNLLVAEKETHSPASVLTANGSDAFGSACSEQINRCLSPNSCTTEMHSVGITPIKNENDNMTSNSSEEEKESLSSGPQSGSKSLDNLVSVKFELISEETEASKGNSTMVQPSTIKLFGRIVSIPDVEKPLIAGVENLKSVTCVSSQGNVVVEKERLDLAFTSNHLDTKLLLSLPHSNSSSLPGGADQNSLENEQANTNSSCLRMWTYGRGFSASNKILVPTPVYACARGSIENKEAVKESFCTGSNSSSISEVENGDKKLDVVDSQTRRSQTEAGISRVGISTRKSTGGFVPYKRCLTERNAGSAVSAKEERRAQRARVCS